MFVVFQDPWGALLESMKVSVMTVSIVFMVKKQILISKK